MEQQGGARTEQMRLALTDCYLSDCNCRLQNVPCVRLAGAAVHSARGTTAGTRPRAGVSFRASAKYTVASTSR